MNASARGSIGGAVDAAASLGEPLRSSVIGAARAEFVDAFSHTLLLAIGVLLVAAALAFARLPARAAAVEADGAQPVEGLALVTFSEAAGQVAAVPNE